MAASTAPSVKAALLTLLEADSGLSGVGFTYADPGEAISQEALFYGRTIATEKPNSMGRRGQHEAYDVEIYVYVAQDGDDPQTCEQRAWAIVAEIENVVRANNGNTGALSAALTPGAGWVVYAGTEMTPFTYSGQRVCEALCKVHVEANK